jgi:transposase
MPRPLSLDSRVRVAAALAEGSTVREATKRFGISIASAVRIGQLARSGHGLAAGKIGGHRQPVLSRVTEAIAGRLATKSDWTVRALAADPKADGIAVSHDTVWRFLRRQGLTIKKNAAGKRDGTAEPGSPADALAGTSTPI